MADNETAVVEAKMMLFDYVTRHNSLEDWAQYLEQTNAYLRGVLPREEYHSFVQNLLGEAGEDFLSFFHFLFVVATVDMHDTFLKEILRSIHQSSS